MGHYDHLERDALIRLLERRDAERQLGLVWERDELDAEAVHPDYGRVFMAGRRRDEKDFLLLHKDHDKLASDGPFALERLRWT